MKYIMACEIFYESSYVRAIGMMMMNVPTTLIIPHNISILNPKALEKFQNSI